MLVVQPEPYESWIDKVVRSTKNLEAPERYFWWAATASIAAAVKKQVYLDRAGHYKLYPNIYVALVSKHSGLRKGLPISLASSFINGALCTRTIEGRNSIQAVINEFSKQVTLENGKVLSDAQGIMVSGEFDTMLLKDPDALTVLTALYNTHEHNGRWRNTLKGTGVEELRNPCISMLVASNETLFDDFVKQKDVEGGFLARTFIVHESKRRTINDLIYKDPDVIDKEKLVQELKDISAISGEFNWSQEGIEVYRPWYRALCEASFDDKTGSVNRLGDSVLKVAMLINLAGKRDLIIHADDLNLAIIKCEECLKGVKTITRSQGISDLAPGTKRVIDQLLAAEGYVMQRKKLLQKIWPDVDAQALDRILDTMEQAECVKALRDDRNQIAYRLTEKAVELYTRFMRNE